MFDAVGLGQSDGAATLDQSERSVFPTRRPGLQKEQTLRLHWCAGSVGLWYARGSRGLRYASVPSRTFA